MAINDAFYAATMMERLIEDLGCAILAPDSQQPLYTFHQARPSAGDDDADTILSIRPIDEGQRGVAVAALRGLSETLRPLAAVCQGGASLFFDVVVKARLSAFILQMVAKLEQWRPTPPSGGGSHRELIAAATEKAAPLVDVIALLEESLLPPIEGLLEGEARTAVLLLIGRALTPHYRRLLLGATRWRQADALAFASAIRQISEYFSDATAMQSTDVFLAIRLLARALGEDSREDAASLIHNVIASSPPSEGLALVAELFPAGRASLQPGSYEACLNDLLAVRTDWAA